MGKFRIIPMLLSNGVSIVKGELFNNWRTVGSIAAAGRLFAAREVDELCFLDVNATKASRLISPEHIRTLAQSLRIPLAAGGGVRSENDVLELLANGADKVVIGRAAFESGDMISRAASIVGSQALSCSVNLIPGDDGTFRLLEDSTRDARYHLDYLQQLGFGEVIIQNPLRDGTMQGIDKRVVDFVSAVVKIPFVISGGVRSWNDALYAHEAGASGVGIGALFQFTNVTPEEFKAQLSNHGVSVRVQ